MGVVGQLSTPVSVVLTRENPQSAAGPGPRTVNTQFDHAYDLAGNPLSELPADLGLTNPIDGSSDAATITVTEDGLWLLTYQHNLTPDASGAAQAAIGNGQLFGLLGAGGPVALNMATIFGGLVVASSGFVRQLAGDQIQIGVTYEGVTADPYTCTPFAALQVTRILSV